MTLITQELMDNPNLFAGNSETTVTIINTDSICAEVRTLNKGNKYVHEAFVICNDDEFIKSICGENEAIKLLLKAVNNRTIERDYFKLYCEMLDNTISEEEFDSTIAANENEYIVSESDIPSQIQLEIALKLSKYIKRINSINDFTSLFSFNYNELHKILEQNNG